jgi:pimeloyl-ACP methyl ester carboxylesterase
MNRHVALAALIVGCHGATPVTPPPAPGPTVTGHLALAPGGRIDRTRGTLFVSWLPEADRQAFADHNLTSSLLLGIISRGTVLGEVDAGRDVPFTVHTGPGRIALMAVVDVDRAGIEALIGGGDDTLTGLSEAFDAASGAAPAIAVSAQPRHERRELCQGERLILEQIEASEVVGSVGNPTPRRVCVRLPKSYAERPSARFPVIYALPGLGSTDAAVIAAYHLEPDDIIVVSVDTSSKTGSSYLVDSPTTGSWDSFFAKKLIPLIDAHYRTIARREGRALVGQSTGGFNSVSYGLRHPELFSVIGASSPDGLDWPVWLAASKRWMVDFARVERGLGGAGQFISYAADWSPRQGGAYDWPFDESGRVVDSVMARWIAHSPTTWVRDPERIGALKAFSGHIYLTVGDHDEFDLRPPTEAFSKTLTEAGIANELVVVPGGHGGHATRIAAIAKFCAAKLEPAK